jgi:hypothetical protein
MPAGTRGGGECIPEPGDRPGWLGDGCRDLSHERICLMLLSPSLHALSLMKQVAIVVDHVRPPVVVTIKSYYDSNTVEKRVHVTMLGPLRDPV